MRVSPRGRAILLPLAAEIAVGRTYRPGDFILTCSRGSLARSTGLATACKINHAALIVDSSGGLIEVNPFFVTAEGGLRRSHLLEYLERGAPVWVGYVELLDGTRDEVVRFAEQMLLEQRRFTEWQFAGLLVHLGMGIAPRSLTGKFRLLRPIHGLFDQHALVLKEENVFTAAELVARALERGGFLWDRDPAYITPAILFERFCPPGWAGRMEQAVPRARVARSQAVIRSGSPRQVWQPGEEGEGAALLPHEPEQAARLSPAGGAASAFHASYPQERVMWQTGALLLGGVMMALGLGWAARIIGMRRG